jgi:acylphosphatase
MLAKRFYIAGRVQGVYYRASARDQAMQLGVVGYAKNLPDGRVEVLAIGAPQVIDALEKWLWQGPPAAQVREVRIEVVDMSTVGGIDGFATR